MLYDISLSITYDYENLADAGRHVLRLVPAELPGEQRVIAHRLQVEPRPAEEIHRTDFFGNQSIEISYNDPVTESCFRMQARVERYRPDEILDVSPGLPELARELETLRAVDRRSPHHYRFASGRIRRDPEIADWAREATSDQVTAFAIAEQVCRNLHAELTFDAEATKVDTPVGEAFRLRRGVCQDFTHIAISALRSLGIPAGYVSGFLRTIPPKGKPRLEGADAMHAWVMAWCGADMGWIEIDPTNAMRAGLDHIVIARGRDYFDVAPVKGSLRTYGAQETKQAVDVLEVSAV